MSFVQPRKAPIYPHAPIQVRPKRRRGGALKVQAVDPCLGYYIPLVHDDPQSRTDNLQSVVIDTSNVDTATATEIGQSPKNELRQCQRSPSPTSSSLELANAEWSTFVPAGPPRHEEALSVEEFLKRSCRRTYGRRRQRRTNRPKKVPQTELLSGQEDGSHRGIDQMEHNGEVENVVQLRSRKVIRNIVPSDASSSDEMDVETSSISFDPPTPLSEKAKRYPKRKKKLLKERIYEAAVVTYCDPDPIFMHPEIKGLADGSVPLPLRFVPGPEPTRPRKAAKTKKRNWTLVDPRKSMAIRTRTFSSRIRPPNLVFDDELLKGDRTGDTCKFTRLGAPSFKTLDRQSSGKKTLNEFEKLSSIGLAPTAIACPPLTFVPIREAEDNYISLNFGRG